MHELQLPSGTVLREYAAGGNVFAVAWNGPTMPNLKQILGQYFPEFVAGVAAGPVNHRHLQLQRGDLIVQSSGRMRAFAGRAYLATHLPAGVSADDVL